MEKIITPEVSDRICKHMNKDHADSVLIYAQYFGQLITAEKAYMVSLDEMGMMLDVTVNDTIQPLQILFPQPLQSAKDAHTVLVEMMKEAQGQGTET